ncbi:hypothetical protein, partial [Lysinibacillus xylanilyticus]|uniref:hypothetical protein n=1 Tax=Lysinibacillus xylanilyticus TaxID=582475 RepID=UPI0036DAB108
TNTINQLRSQGEVVSENFEDGLVTLVIKINRKHLQESLRLAFLLTTVKEVSTDGKTIAVTFISSAK